VIPRYTSALDLRSWLDWLGASSRASAGAELQSRLTVPPDRTPHCFVSARDALCVYMEELAREKKREVVMSSQICPVVARVTEQVGLRPVFVDIDGSLPVPSADAILAATAPDTAAVVVAPLYGHSHPSWPRLARELGPVRLVLDLAQGLLAAGAGEAALQQAADAAVYSFALGKGIDTGGAVLYVRGALPTPRMRGLPAPLLAGFVRAAGLRLVDWSGVYSLLLGQIERAVDSDKEFRRSRRPGLAPGVEALWVSRLGRFAAEVARARARARALASNAAVRRVCPDVDYYCGAESNHLRQILFFADPGVRDAVFARLRGAGIDCAPAGEPLPEEYTTTPPGRFPAAAAFRRHALRLPFLGRLSEMRFEHVFRALEAALA
jgi:dTDP-4-amino-4,6-dideoxygalactose transaminase